MIFSPSGQAREVQFVTLLISGKLPLGNFITAGNSGNDIDMLKGKTKGIVVANYSPELEELKKNKSIYFAKQILSKGVLEGIQHHIETIGFEAV